MDVRQIFNAGVTCHAISIADRLGVFDALEEHGSLSLSEWEGGTFRRDSLTTVLALLQAADIVFVSVEGTVRPGPRLAECISRKALFTWFFHASSPVVLSGPDLIRGAISTSPARDGALVGSTMGDLGRRHIDKTLFSMINWGEFKCVMDVGCGDASRVQSISERFGIAGVGLELSEAALAVAKSRTEGASSLSLISGNALEMKFDEALQRKIDIVLMSLLAHDLLPEDRAVKTFRMWKSRLPNLKRLVICETVRTGAAAKSLSSEVPELGYELLHSLMGVELETDATWRRIFKASGWTVVSSTELEIPANTVIYICDRA